MQGQAQTLLASRESLLRPFARADILERADLADRSPVLVEQRSTGGGHPPLLAVVRADDAVGAAVPWSVGRPVDEERALHLSSITRVNAVEESVARHWCLGWDAEDVPCLGRPLPAAGDEIGVPDSGGSRLQGEPQTLLPVPQSLLGLF